MKLATITRAGGKGPMLDVAGGALIAGLILGIIALVFSGVGSPMTEGVWSC
jgi:hypothetical protein